MGDQQVPETLLRAPELSAPHAFETRHGDLSTALPGRLLRLRQVHGGEVHVIRQDTPLGPYAAASVAERPAGDALVTAQRGVTVGVITADCVPVLFHDPVRGVVAAAHAGWRGIAAGIVSATIATMTDQFGCDARDFRAAIGPCVGASAYRVGPEVAEQFQAIGLPSDLFRAPITDATGGRTTHLCDLGRAVGLQLRDLGVAPSAVWLASRCTVSEKQLFHSYRRDGEAAGRMTAGIALP